MENPAALGREADPEPDDIGRLAPDDRLTIEDDLPLRVVHEAHDRLEGAALAGAVATDERDRLAHRDIEADLPRAECAAVADLQVLNAEQRHGHAPDTR